MVILINAEKPLNNKIFFQTMTRTGFVKIVPVISKLIKYSKSMVSSLKNHDHTDMLVPQKFKTVLNKATNKLGAVAENIL